MSKKLPGDTKTRAYSPAVRSLALLPGLSLLLLITLAACRQNKTSVVVANSADSGGYVGSAACAACHPVEARTHGDSRHAHAMRAARPTALGPLTPPPGIVPLAGYALEVEADQLTLRRSIAPTGPIPLNLALGSGKVGITFVSIQGPDTLLEAHMSYFPEGRQWDTTPGQQDHREGDTAFGRPKSGDEARRCLGCHSVTLPTSALMPEARFLGVGCESCHGPGKAHIDAIQAHDLTHPHMERLGQLSSDKLNALCGKCHRTLKDIDIQSPEGSQTHRFQPYALLRSRCRNRDGSVLSCLTCHDPHKDVSVDIRRYEAECLQCHTDREKGKGQDDRRSAENRETGMNALSTTNPLHTEREVVGKVCPVNAKTGCIGCHMRDRQSFPGLFWKPMVDHLISLPSRTRSAHTNEADQRSR